jgi:hypothetical protein
LRTRLDHNRSVPSVFSWAPFRSTKAAVKLHTLFDLRGSIPSVIFISNGKFHDVNVLDYLVPEAGATPSACATSQATGTPPRGNANTLTSGRFA